MANYTKIIEHLSLADLQERYQQSTDVVEANHWQIIWWLACSKRVSEVAILTGKSENWIRELARRYNRLGPTGLADKRKTLPGVKPLLTETLQQELDAALQQPHPDGGQWNGPKVAAWITSKIGRKIGRQVGLSYLYKLNYALLQPRPQHSAADKQAQAEFKKNSLVE
jgi:transposase